MDSRINQHQEHKIKVLLEQLELLRITEENTLERTTEYMDNMLTIPVVYNGIVQAIMPKSMISDPRWFDSN